MSGVLAVALTLGLSLLLSAMFWSGLAAYMNFIFGLFAGSAIGWTWATAQRSKLGVIDVGLIVFLGVVTLQVLFTSFGLQAGHRVVIAWGGSNFVASVLIAASLLMVARLRDARMTKWRWYFIPLAAIAAAMSTLSRGAAVALAAGGIVLLWNLGSTPRVRLILRAACTLIPVVAIAAVGLFTYRRTLVNQQAIVNIAARFDLLALAWDGFLRSPVFGTGWASLRESSGSLGGETTFAHNFVLSFMQLGGIAGLIFIGLLCVLIVRVLRVGGMLAASVVSAMTTALFDLFLESFIGGLLTFAAAVFILSERRGDPLGGEF
jgi:O-antigen ligase